LFPQWELLEAGSMADVDASRIRKILFEAENPDMALDVLAHTMPDEVRQYLQSWRQLPCFEQLCREHQIVQAYKDAWSSAPYPPVFTTVDAVVKAADHVLLIKRGRFPGMCLWALPGGFIDQRESLLQGALRELQEETHLGVLPETLLDALKKVVVFDHPDRSLRGRTITHAHFFDLNIGHLPEVRADDDAACAAWVKISELAATEEFFFDDHFHILDHFLGLTGHSSID
jgi:bifunctional NMN adenylyltransferase/nudix hydrolase